MNDNAVLQELLPELLPADMMPRAEELPGDLARLAVIIDEITPGQGVEITLRIAAEFRGTTVYCHNIDALYRKSRDRWIREQFDPPINARVPDLARAAKLSERRVWEILGTEPVNERQMRLF